MGAIDSQSASTSKILSYVNKESPMHVCGNGPQGNGLSYIFDPTGEGIQLDMGVSLPNDCQSQFGAAISNTTSRRLKEESTIQLAPLTPRNAEQVSLCRLR